MKKHSNHGLLMSAIGAGAALGLGAALRRTRSEDLTGQVVLITGGSRGLGLAMAQEFLASGCHVAICARDEVELSTAQALLERDGSQILALPCDVSDRIQVDDLIGAVRSWHGRIDVLVCNAGEISVAPVEDATIADFERAMAVMFWGVVYPTLAVLDEMKARRRGRIAAITSIGGKVSVPHLLPYCSAKFAAVGFCEGLRAEMAPHGVKITTIAPGLMRTGSHLKAEFKGQHASEAAWFSLSATSPVTSMSARRAARQIVNAIRQGKSEKILSTQANLLARMNGAFPGTVPNLLGIVNRLLPDATADRQSSMTGAEIQPTQARWLRALTILGRKAAQNLNQSGSEWPDQRDYARS